MSEVPARPAPDQKKTRPSPTVTVRMTALATGGSCVGDVIEPAELAGKKAFVPWTAPGELVQGTVTKSKKNFVEADLLAIIEPSTHRISPPCPYFGSCGGCDLQHLDLPWQREVKRSMVETGLKMHGGVEASEGVTILADDLPGFGYRRRMSFHLNKKQQFGLYRKNGRSIVEIDHCMISTDLINRTLAATIPLLKECAPEAETITIEDHDGEIFMALEVHPRSADAVTSLIQKAAFKELEGKIPNIQVDFRHKVSYRPASSGESPPVGHFSQNNAAANEHMLHCIAQYVTTERVTDLYAGAGNISIPLARAGHQVNAVELDPHLVSHGRSKAAKEKLTERVTFVQDSCEKWIESGSPDQTVVLDPPRGGAAGVAERLSPTVSPRLVYVSCFPPTFSRDSQILVQRGYALRKVEVLDMFPQTYHAELIAVFEAA